MTRCAPAPPPTVVPRRARPPWPFGLAVAVLGGCAAGPVPVPQAGRPPTVQAEIAAAGADPSDPVAARLAVYLRLLTPSGGTASEIAQFLKQNPGWPNHALLVHRLDQALAAETDPSVLGALCGEATPVSSEALLRCAGTGGIAGTPPGGLPAVLPPAIVAAARSAWTGGLDQPEQAAAFQRVWGQYLTPDDAWRRFDRLEWAGNVASAQQVVPLLAATAQPLAIARLALRRNEAGADGIASALQGAAVSDPALVFDLARWLRRADRDDEATALWRSRGFAAEAQAAATRLPAFWTERDALARDLLKAGRDPDALLLADDALQHDPGPRSDSGFLAGWIALRRLHDPAGAQARFAPLLASEAAITRSRGEYWTGRARLAAGDAAGGEAALARAAAYPTTFYGQLAAARLVAPAPGPATLLDPASGHAVVAARLLPLHDPRWSSAEAIRFAGLELARAAELLVAWNDPHHARAFLLKLDQAATTDTDHALAASLADRLGLPDVAVAIARAAGRHGLVLVESGWPRPYTPASGNPLPAGLVLAVMRQESSFDPQIVSPAGARGLMQLTTGTARDTARGLGWPELAAGGGTSLFDPDVNQTLGSAYMDGLLTRFGGVVPYAVAAYNAGPHRVDRWLADNGDPARLPSASPDDRQAQTIDWIELIPFAETRNYVQRVMENMVIYQAAPGSRT